MNVLQIAGFAVAAAVVVLLLRQMKPELGTAGALGAGAALLALTLPFLSQVVEGIDGVAASGEVAPGFLQQLLRIAGVSLLMDFAAQTCRDAGENGLAVKAELCGRIMLLALALPSMRALLNQLMVLAP